MSIRDALENTVQVVRNTRGPSSFDESRTKNGMILPILRSLGWDPFDINEVYPEYSVENGRVDYSLRISGSNKVFVEAKRAGEILDSHEEQLLRYAFHEGVSLAVLTNGLAWWLYLPLQLGSWRVRRFQAVDIRLQSPSDISSCLIQFLSRDLVESGEAVKKR